MGSYKVAPSVELVDGSLWHIDRDDNQISIENMAYSLARLCRFTGHCSFNDHGPGRIYSVAEHSVRATYITPTAEMLLHDGHEAITHDMSTPVKQYIGDGYTDFEDNCARQVARQYGFRLPLSDRVQHTDTLMVLIEAYYMIPSKGAQWGYPESVREEALRLQAARPILRPAGWSPDTAMEYFIRRYEELTRC